MSLKVLDSVAPVYSVPRDDLVRDVMVPAMSASTVLRCMVGFFDSGAFRQLAPGLAAFVNGSRGPFELLASPQIDARDQDAIQEALTNPAAVIERTSGVLFEEARLSESAVARHNYDCLAYLIACGRLEMRFALMRSGLFHPKVWIFFDGTAAVVVHGSSNLTTPGLLWNYETVSVERPWRGEDPAAKVEKFTGLFRALWDGTDPDAVVVPLPEAIRYGLLRHGDGLKPPPVEDFWAAWSEDARRGLAPPLPRRASTVTLPAIEPARLRIPDGLVFDRGPFAHQGRAVAAWEEAGHRGILAMATGSGKTIAALVGASRLLPDHEPMFVVVAAPYRPLIEQWEEEVAGFRVAPVAIGNLSGAKRDARLEMAIRSLVAGVSKIEVAVVTHDYLTSRQFKRLLTDVPDRVRTLLIADEVHNLGRPAFIEDPPERFQFRLGLSATPERQYDPVGTARLFEFFGRPVFEFGLVDAIRVCLVPYDYHIHTVGLSDEEHERWLELTEQLTRAGFGSGDAEPDESGRLSSEVMRLLVKRRAVLETCGGKLGALVDMLRRRPLDGIRHTLIYASDKGSEQLEEVNRALHDLGITFHQLTEAETGSRKVTRGILDRFGAGEFRAITCKRVLDEGVDIPQVAEAYLLASSTVRRQWIQRRGRILRRCDAIGKTLAVLHDFVVVPPDQASAAGRAILRQEIARAREFATLAANAGDEAGPFQTIAELG